MRPKSIKRFRSEPQIRRIPIIRFSPGKRRGVKLTHRLPRHSPDLNSPSRILGAETARPRLVDFQFYAPRVRSVSLVGFFNPGSADMIPLQHLGGGAWVVRLLLNPGRYIYHFVADGQKQLDPVSVECAFNPTGGMASVAVIE